MPFERNLHFLVLKVCCGEPKKAAKIVIHSTNYSCPQLAMCQAELWEVGDVISETDLHPWLIMLSIQGKASGSRPRAAKPATCDNTPLHHAVFLELNDTVSTQCYLYFASLSIVFHSHLLWTPQKQGLDDHLHGHDPKTQGDVSVGGISLDKECSERWEES